MVDKLIRSLLWSIPIVLLYYLQAWHTGRFEWLERPYHLRIWNVPGGCLPMEHWTWLDWIGAVSALFILQATITGAIRLGRRLKEFFWPTETDSVPQI